MLRPRNVLLPLMIWAAFSLVGCDDDDGENTAQDMAQNVELNIAVCAPDAGPFSLDIDNPFTPFPVGQRLILEGEDDEGTTIRVEITVLDETEVVAGVTTRVVEEREFEDGGLIEVSRNFFAQAPDDTVCYYGEDVDMIEDGEVVSNEGQWRAGEGDNQPGIFMPGAPAVGQTFALESAPGIAEDHAEIIAMGETVTVPAGEFSNTLRQIEQNPFNGDQDEKVFAAGAGLIVDADIQLISFGL